VPYLGDAAGLPASGGWRLLHITVDDALLKAYHNGGCTWVSSILADWRSVRSHPSHELIEFTFDLVIVIIHVKILACTFENVKGIGKKNQSIGEI
jgi:hypothetical protein